MGEGTSSMDETKTTTPSSLQAALKKQTSCCLPSRCGGARDSDGAVVVRDEASQSLAKERIHGGRGRLAVSGDQDGEAAHPH